MLLNNFTATLYSDLKTVTTANVTTKNSTFNYTSIQSKPASEYGNNAGQLYLAPFQRGIAFGSGTTPPQKTDYKLENHIADGLTYSNNSTSETNNVANWVQTVQNTSGETITISEVGLFSSYASGSPTVLLTRTVLDNPVVLQPNDVKTFTITIDYNKFVDGTIIQNS